MRNERVSLEEGGSVTDGGWEPTVTLGPMSLVNGTLLRGTELDYQYHLVWVHDLNPDPQYYSITDTTSLGRVHDCHTALIT